jgi:hypothetical protein
MDGGVELKMDDKDEQIRILTEELAKSREGHRWALQQITQRAAEAGAAQAKQRSLIEKYEPEKATWLRLPTAAPTQPPVNEVRARSAPAPLVTEEPTAPTRSWVLPTVVGVASAVAGAIGTALAGGLL